MIKLYKVIQGDHESIAKKLNELNTLYTRVNFINTTPAMFHHPLNPKQQVPGLICFCEFEFASDIQKTEFDIKLQPEKSIKE